MGWVQSTPGLVSRQVGYPPDTVTQSTEFSGHIERYDPTSGKWGEVGIGSSVRPNERIRIVAQGRPAYNAVLAVSDVRVRLWAPYGLVLDEWIHYGLFSDSACPELQLPVVEGIYPIRLDTDGGTFTQDETYGFNFVVSRQAPPVTPGPKPPKPFSLPDFLFGKNTILYLGLGGLAIAGVVTYALLRKK